MDIQKLRTETPHCQDKIFLDSAGSSLMPISVVNRMKAYIDEESQIGGYRMAAKSLDEVNDFYLEAAKMLNCKAHNIAYAFNATDAFAQAVYSIPFEKGDVIITSDDDYFSNHVQFSMIHKRFGSHTIRVRNHESGSIDLGHMEELIREHEPKLVCITHVPTNTGKVQDVQAVGKLCEAYDILYIVDACQSIGQMPVDVKDLRCDFLSVTGRKFLRGPRGTGFLYISDRVLKMGLTPLRLDGWSSNWIAPAIFEFHESARRFEVFEQSYSCTLGFKEAIRYANEVDPASIYEYNQQLLSRLRHNLSEQGNILFLDRGEHLVNIFTFQKKGASEARMIKVLQENNVYFSSAFRGAALIDFDKKGVDWAIRLSPHYFNTLEEMDQVSDIIASI